MDENIWMVLNNLHFLEHSSTFKDIYLRPFSPIPIEIDERYFKLNESNGQLVWFGSHTFKRFGRFDWLGSNTKLNRTDLDRYVWRLSPCICWPLSFNLSKNGCRVLVSSLKQQPKYSSQVIPFQHLHRFYHLLSLIMCSFVVAGPLHFDMVLPTNHTHPYNIKPQLCLHLPGCLSSKPEKL